MADTVPGNVQWSGEHWINYLRRPGEETDSGSFSMYHTRYSQGGTGTVAFVDVPAADFATICTRNDHLIRIIVEVFWLDLPGFQGLPFFEQIVS